MLNPSAIRLFEDGWSDIDFKITQPKWGYTFVEPGNY